MRARLPLLLLALLSGVGACEGGEVVVFSAAFAGSAGEIAMAGVSAGAGGAADGLAGSIGPGSSGGTSGTGGSAGNSVDKSCQTTADCDQAWYCQKQICADPVGVCHPNPPEGDPVAAAVCGCDNKTYFNDTLRQLKGISASTIGSCDLGVKPCVDDHECGPDPDARCFRHLRDVSGCMNSGSGQCWVVPSDCSGSDKADLLLCLTPGQLGGPPPQCLTLCQAINSGRPFFNKRRDDICP